MRSDRAEAAHRHPLHPNVRRSPYFQATEVAGAIEYMVYNHMYLPIDYGRPAEEDYRALLERVTLWDVGAERQTELTGPGALDFADFLTPRDLRDLAVGRCRYGLVCDDQGVIMTECIVLHPRPDTIWFSHGDVDLTLWANGITLGRCGGLGDLSVAEPDVAPLQLQGPRSPAVIDALVGTPPSNLPPFGCAWARIAGADVLVSRTGWSGEVGFELYPLGSERALDIWDAVLEAGRSHGILVTGPNLVRACERAITDTHYFVSGGMTPFEAGKPWAVELDGGPFVGREALRAAAAHPARRRTVGLVATAADPLPRLEGFWPVTAADRLVGEIRWAVWSIALRRPIAIALLDSAVAVGSDVMIRHPAGEAAARVTSLPFVPVQRPAGPTG